mmetsp:Transcript_12291/g.14968  ORF Transcript_12291/g.14968 Transcript_12291/m.14968 type:complete len:101 (-) Transcript_12291:537-839(-)
MATFTRSGRKFQKKLLLQSNEFFISCYPRIRLLQYYSQTHIDFQQVNHAQCPMRWMDSTISSNLPHQTLFRRMAMENFQLRNLKVPVPPHPWSHSSLRFP